MPEQIKILSSRRAYEFGADKLRLTILSAQQVQQQILQTFQFQAAQTGTPPETFGPVPQTTPPGLLFLLGSLVSPNGEVLPIRILAFEPRRVVLDVVGPSSSIDLVYETLEQLLNNLTTPDGSAVLGKPDTILDFSEVTAHLSFQPDAGLIPGLNALFTKVLGAEDSEQQAISVPIYTAQLHATHEEFPGAKNTNKGFLQFTLRAGTKVDERIYFSGAPLTSDAHIAYLAELEALLSKKRASR
jgi:hypothetical protein